MGARVRQVLALLVVVGHAAVVGDQEQRAVGEGEAPAWRGLAALCSTVVITLVGGPTEGLGETICSGRRPSFSVPGARAAALLRRREQLKAAEATAPPSTSTAGDDPEDPMAGLNRR